MLYDKSGAVFELDHEIGDISYVRPMVKVIAQSSNYRGDDFYETEGYEPADFLVVRNRSDLFESPPEEAVDAELRAKRQGLEEFTADAEKKKKEVERSIRKAEQDLQKAQQELTKWFSEHQVMMDLGKLLDGQVLYPLSVDKSQYHSGRDIPRIPKMKDVKYLSIEPGDFEKGQKWVCRRYGVDRWGKPFRFFDTEGERSEAIASEFRETCDAFRLKPLFDAPKYTTTTMLSYTTLEEWVKTHSFLEIPADIKAMKSAHDADTVKKKREQLAKQLAELEQE